MSRAEATSSCAETAESVQGIRWPRERVQRRVQQTERSQEQAVGRLKVKRNRTPRRKLRKTRKLFPDVDAQETNVRI